MCGVGIDRWPTLCGQERSCLIERKKEGERAGTVLSCLFDREAYLLGHSFPPEELHHTPNRCLLCICTPLLINISPPSLCLSLSPFHCLSPSVLLFSFFLLIPKSDSDRWRSRLPCQCLPPSLLPQLPVFSCAPSSRHGAKGLPMNFLLQGLIRYYLAA